MATPPLTLNPMKAIFWFTLFTFSFFTASAQLKPVDKLNYVLTYKLSTLLDTVSSIKKVDVMRLEVGDTIQKFFSHGLYLQDSMALQLSKGKQVDVDFGLLSLPKAVEKYRIIKNYRAKKISHNEVMVISTFEYEEVLQNLKWTILKQRDTLSGYTVQKATTHFTGRDYEAWFTQELPIQAAPYKFDGLPGVVLKVQDTRKQYVFELQSFHKVKKNSFIYKADLKTFKTTRKGFFKVRNNVHTMTFNELLQARGMADNVTFDEETTQKNETLKVKRKNNNPIELE